ncbi:MAG: ABC transporter permease [Aminobacterium sp.]|nr:MULTISPECIES: ABC transporter permease [unclassified Aminobacterium]MDD2206437.1 ABC transporter permease [Aminobacterium sp.]MDD3425333.1 ABC transporter permease [Aminobacterium sp.]MDD3706928.1 ABC transporter permease [Aminobacterium sp.]MDD4228228.1 ABC transporter permease [Aminobacterium sp.]MDD4551265.1 ABC transporter permease [Aminobacterium sp.]
MTKKSSFQDNLSHFFVSNAVPIIFLALSAVAIPISRFSTQYLVQEMLVRLARDSFLVLSLLIPIMAGMGLNFGMVLGAMAGEIGLILITDWNIVGIPGMVLAMIISTPLAVLLGWMCGVILNRAKGREMVTSFILGFFMNGVYQLIVLYGFGSVFPIKSPDLVLSRGFGIRNVTNLENIRKCLDNLIPLSIGGVAIPIATFLVIAAFCVFVVWFRKTKLGQDMRAVGQDMDVAEAAGIPVERTRIISIVISTVLACYGQIIFLQNIGTMNTYNSHEQAGMFAIAALLVGGASVTKATIPNVFIGVILFHLMFVVSPMAGKYLIGQAQLGEYFRVFVSYGIIAIALVLHAWRRQQDKDRARRALRGNA